MKQERKRSTTTRRQFLAGLGGIGAGMAAGAVGLGDLAVGPATRAYAQAAARSAGAPPSPQYFGRLFPKLAPFGQDTNEVTAALMEVGAKGGIMDALDDLSAGPEALLDRAAYDGEGRQGQYGTNPDNPTQTAGSGFFGQFVDHDMSFDQSSLLAKPQNPLQSPNSRTPNLDLDSVFGGGPKVSPHLYAHNASNDTYGPQLLIGTGGAFEDVPRSQRPNGSYVAILADPRNDQTIALSGLQCATILFYNTVLANLGSLDLSYLPASMRAGTDTPYGQYVAARQVTALHYQWLIVNCHLPQICGQSTVTEILQKGNRFYKPPAGDAFVPIEFSSAAYRYGHSVIRPSYRVNFTSGTGPSTSPTADPFYALTFDPGAGDFNKSYDRDDMLGGYPAARRYVGWQSFFDAGDGQLILDKRIDTSVSTVLFDLPVPAIPAGTQTSPVVLPQRTLLRHLTWGLPSGQAVAAAMGNQVLSSADLADITSVYQPFGTSTPLWYYLLAESKVMEEGKTLGPSGARIVAEVIIGILRADPNSYLGGYQSFSPSLGSDFAPGPNTDSSIAGSHEYTMANFLHYAGVLSPGQYR